MEGRSAPRDGGTIITFYSYKGGTGRSMALANVAWILASNGRRVLVIDWDLEAPGLYRFFTPFLPDPTLTETEGLIDFVINFANEAATPREAAPSSDGQPAWFEPLANILPYAVSLTYPFPTPGAIFPKPGTIDFVPAGRQGPGYAHRVEAFDWGNFYERMGGGVFLEAAKRQMRVSYDYILIDSRTGISDTSGICTVQMPDILVACFTANNQSIEGTAAVAESVRAQWEANPNRAGTARQIYPVLNRVDPSEQGKLERRREYIHILFDTFIGHLTVTERADYWRSVEIPYIPFYAYEEVLATFGDKYRQETGLLAAMERLTAFLTGKEVRQFEQPPAEKERREVLRRYELLGSAKTEKVPDESGNGAQREVKATYDVFLSYSSPDGPAVEQLARRLKRAGIEPFLDTWNLIPGGLLQEALQDALINSTACAVFIGPEGFSPWQHEELRSVIEHRVSGSRGGFRVIPVLLPGASRPAEEGLPRFLLRMTWIQFSQTLDDVEAFHNLVCGILGIPPGMNRGKGSFEVECPYRGLEPFGPEHAPFFFGRDQEVEELVQSLRLHPFWAVIGPSGSGKSSLVFAGLIPALYRSGLFGAGQWLVRTLRPGEKPLAALAEALGGDPADPARVVAKAIESEPDARRLLLVVDQFEELFTVARTDAEAFQHALRRLAETPDAYVIVTARADFYPDLMVAPLWPEIRAHRVEVVLLDEGGLRQAIVRPAEAVGVFVEEALVERLVADAAGEPGVLPLIQETLVLLWERLERRLLPLRAYEALTLPHGTSGVSGGERTGLQVAMARRADAALAALSTPEKQAIARRIFLRLVQFGEGRADTRRQQTVAELSLGSDPTLFKQALDHLADRRLLTLGGDLSGDGRIARQSVDLAHEALISGWPQLQFWLNERREAEQTRRRLEAKAAEWVRLGRSTGGLLDGDELPKVVQWLAGPDVVELGSTDNLADLVRASRTYQEKMRASRRQITLFHWGSVGLIALVISYILYDDRLRAAQRQTQANGLVTALETANIREVPRLIDQLQVQADRDLIRDRLRALTRADPEAPSGLRRHLNAALALLPDDPAQVGYLVERMLQADARPDELLVIRQALYDHGHAPALTPKLRAKLEVTPTGLTDSQLRAAGALALFEPKDPRWPALGPRVAAKLVRQNPLLVDDWREAFQTVAPALTPPLRRHFADRSQPEQRALAFVLLFEFVKNSPADDPRRATEDLIELISEADPAQFEQVLELLQADRARVIDLLAGKLDKLARFEDAPAHRQGQIAMALVRLKQADLVWPLLKHSDDPSVRTELIHDLAKFGVEPGELIARLYAEPEVSARRALVLALGGYHADRVPADERQKLTSKLLAWYREDPDPGVHGGIAWLLRQKWGQAEALDRIDRELASRKPPQGRNWYINGQGQTFAVVRGPVEFHMGSPVGETHRDGDEILHRERINRSFAIATREVTVAQYMLFLKENPGVANYLDFPQFKQGFPTPDCAMGMVDCYDAARYCNWLSRKEGISEDQWCYPGEIGPGMTLPADLLERTGYRLPTEAEWEYACRAGSEAAWPYGGSEALLSEYGWYLSNTRRRMQPVGKKKPNDLGLFDVLGNAYEWTLDPYEAYQPNLLFLWRVDTKFMDAKQAKFSHRVICTLRGGSISSAAPNLRSADRDWVQPPYLISLDGLRPARTYH